MVFIVPTAPRVFSIGVRMSDSGVLSLRRAHHACMLGDTTQPRSPIEHLFLIPEPWDCQTSLSSTCASSELQMLTMPSETICH